MVISTTRAILLSQLKNTREEVVKLKKNFEILQRVFYETAIDSLSKEEKILYEMVKSGKLKNNLLKTQEEVSLFGFLPNIKIISANGYYFGSYFAQSQENKKAIESLGLNTGLLTGVNNQLSWEVSYQIKEFLDINFPEPVPLFLGKEPSGKSLIELKKRCPAKVFDRLIYALNDYINSMREVITLFQEVDCFLQRDEVTIEYLKKNFQELYKLYEDGK